MNTLSINILLVEDNPGDAYIIENLLRLTETPEFKITHVDTLAKAVSCSKEQIYDAVLLDLILPDSLVCLNTLTKMMETNTCAIVVLTGIEDWEFAIGAVKQGAQDYLIKGQVNQELVVRTIRSSIERSRLLRKLCQKEQHLKQLNDELRRQNEDLKYLLSIAHTDRLTNLANRYSYEKIFEREWKYAVRNSTSLSVIMIDIDYFKIFNDTYGHLQGDHCLYEVAQAIKMALKRPKDLAIRYGGEEFLTILPDTNLEGAIVIAETIGKSIKDLKIENLNAEISNLVTVSLGIATIIPHKTMKPKNLIARADQALYLAKQNGRDRFEVYDESKVLLSDSLSEGFRTGSPKSLFSINSTI